MWSRSALFDKVLKRGKEVVLILMKQSVVFYAWRIGFQKKIIVHLLDDGAKLY